MGWTLAEKWPSKGLDAPVVIHAVVIHAVVIHAWTILWISMHGQLSIGAHGQLSMHGQLIVHHGQLSIHG